jgi:hypothetical protein
MVGRDHPGYNRDDACPRHRPGDNTTIYATDREADRLYKSTDTGASWVELAKPAGAAEPQLVAVAPDNINLVTIVADNSEVYISADGGAGCIFHE